MGKPGTRYLIIIIVFLLISFLCVLAYFNSATNPFIWDDEGLIIKNTLIKDWHSWPKAFSNDLFFGSLSGSNFYRPVQTISYIWDYFFWQLNPIGYHITNILLQISVSFLAFLLIYVISGKLIVSFAAAALFAVHPVHTESVTYISGRADLFLGLFVLAALLAFIRSLESDARGKRFYFYISLILFILGLLSKELAATFPFLILAFIFYYRKDDFKKSRFFVQKVLPFFIIDFIYLILRLSPLRFITSKPPVLTNYPFLLRLVALPKVIFSYLKLLILPVDLHMSRSFNPPEDFWPVFLTWFLLGIVMCVFLNFARNNQRRNAIYFTGVWFLIFLLPQAGIVPINAFIAEHFIYLSSLSFCVLVAFISYKFLKKEMFVFTFSGLVIFYILLTISRNTEWKYPVVFYERLIKFSPNSFMAHNNLGLEYQRRRQYDKGISEYKKALIIAPGLLEARSNLANLYYEMGRFKDAEREYAIVQKCAPLSKLGEVANNIASIYEAEGLLNKAVDKYKLALRLDSTLKFSHFNLARIYLARGDLNLARQEIISSLPGVAPTDDKMEAYLKVVNNYLMVTKKYKSAFAFYNDLGARFAEAGYFEPAIESFKLALELHPRYQEAYFNLGLAYYKGGLKGEALAVLKRALKINPNHRKTKELIRDIAQKNNYQFLNFMLK